MGVCVCCPSRYDFSFSFGTFAQWVVTKHALSVIWTSKDQWHLSDEKVLNALLMPAFRL